MAVTDNTTLIEDHETTPTFTSIGGGQGAVGSADFYYKGANSSVRRMDNVTKEGFWWTDGTAHDVSGTGTHVLFWINCITQALFTDFWVRLGTSTTVYEEHNPGVGFYDIEAGGWIPIWVEVNAGTDTGTPDFTQIDFFAVICTMGDIASQLKNLQTDQARYATRPVLLWDGSSGDLDDFITTESNATTGGQGSLKLVNGLYTCFSNFKIGSAAATTFDMAGKVIAFPDATWLPAASVWMGIDIDLQHASTDIDATGGSIISGNPGGASARKPDFLVTGTNGVLDISNRVFDGMRLVTLTSGVTALVCVFANSGVITPAGADMRGTSILTSAVDPDVGALYYNETGDPDGELDDMTFSKGGNSHHAIQFGTNAPTTMTLRGMTFTDFSAVNEQSTSVILLPDKGSDQIWTINSVGNTGTLSYKKTRAGDTVNIVADPVTLTLTGLIANTEVRIYETGTTTEVDGVENSTTSFAFAYTLPHVNVDIVVHHVDYIYQRLENITLGAAAASLPIQQIPDRVFENPA